MENTVTLDRTAEKKLTHRLPVLLLPVIVLCLTSIAGAELGGTVSSVQSDREFFKGTVQVTHAGAYDVHGIKTAAGSSIREYVSPDGKVFAVAWSSAGHPDMKQLLGTYFEQYQRVLQAPRTGRGPLSVHESGLAVELGGHPRAFTGRVYVPGLVPQGVDLENIR
ncbi:MAG: DUF2844 domain-containing protein [Terriglobales bacterium]|jgi:hypothetical protein